MDTYVIGLTQVECGCLKVDLVLSVMYKDWFSINIQSLILCLVAISPYSVEGDTSPKPTARNRFVQVHTGVTESLLYFQ